MLTIEQACRILGLPERFTLRELKAQYRKLAATYHPDVAGTGDAGRFIEINLAYELLREVLGRTGFSGESEEPSQLELELERQVEALRKAFEQLRQELNQWLEKRVPQAVESLARIVAAYPSRPALQEKLVGDTQAWAAALAAETVQFLNQRLSRLCHAHRDWLADYLAEREAELERQRKTAARRPRFVWVSMTVGTVGVGVPLGFGLAWPWSLGLGVGLGLACAGLSLIPLYCFTPLPDFAERYRLPQAAFQMAPVSIDLSTDALITQEGAERLGAIGGGILGCTVGGPVGAVIGLLLGLLFGSRFGETLAEYKQKLWNRLAPELDGLLNTLFGRVDAQLNDTWTRLEKQVRANYEQNRTRCLRLLTGPTEGQ